MTRHITRVLFTSGLISLFLTSGCEVDKRIIFDCSCKESTGKICVLYEQTYCADPWGQDNTTDEQLVENLAEYFDSLGVTLYNIGIDDNGTQQFCFACNCKSGRRFCAKVKNSDLTIVKEHGFTEN